MIDLSQLADSAILFVSQVVAPLLWYVAGFVFALFIVLMLLFWFLDLLE